MQENAWSLLYKKTKKLILFTSETQLIMWVQTIMKALHVGAQIVALALLLDGLNLWCFTHWSNHP